MSRGVHESAVLVAGSVGGQWVGSALIHTVFDPAENGHHQLEAGVGRIASNGV